MKRTLFLLIAVAIIITSVTRAQVRSLTPDQKLRYAEAIIEGYYVDSVASDSLVNQAIISMLATLDPHSSYSSPEETRELTQPLSGKFSGIGIQFSIVRDTVCVVQTTVGGPAERVGMLPGDRIIYVNDTLFTHAKMTIPEVHKFLRGPKGTVANLKVKRGDSQELINFRIVRDDIPIYSIDAAYMVTPEVGFISISRFAEETADELDKAIDKLAKKGMKHLILDLEDNGGGFLGAGFNVAARFLNYGDTVVYTIGRVTEPTYFRVENRNFGSLFKDSKYKIKEKSPIDRLVITVNQYSASASEIVAGAIQDNDRGVIVGRRTFGKGLVQRPFPFPDGSMIRLTTSRYYTPAGRCIQKHYDKGHGEEYQLDMLNRYNSGELFSADSIHFDESLKTYTLKNHRPVYGGGGIMPDKFVPLDTTYFSTYYRDIVAKGSISTFVVNTIENQRKELLKKYPNEEAFYNKFTITQELINGLVAQATEDGVKFDQQGFDKSAALIKGALTGLFARDLYKDGTYIRAVNHLNPVFNEAVRIITDPEAYNSLLSPSQQQ